MPSTTLLVLLCAVPFVALFAVLGIRQTRRERQAMRDFAASLDGGTVAGRRAEGRWRGVDVSVGFFGRRNPPVFLTAVAARRRRSPFVALLVPSDADTEGYPLRLEPPQGAPQWMVTLHRTYDVGCAPEESLCTVIDEATARVLNSLHATEVEVLPGHVNIQRREVLYDASQLRPLLDAAVQLVGRLDAVHGQLAATSEEDRTRRESEATRFLNGVRRRGQS